MTDQRAFRPDRASPPGDTIAELLEERGWTQVELAERTGYTRKHINELLAGKKSLTPDAASRLERVLGSTAEFWLNREAHYQAAVARLNGRAALAEEQGWLRELPTKDMISYGWLRKGADEVDQVRECLSYFSVNSVADWRTVYGGRVAASFRASSRFSRRPGAVAAWLRAAEIAAQTVETEPFDPHVFMAALGKARGLTMAPDPANFIETLRSLCAKSGVAVVLVPAPRGCPIRGACQWITSDRALIALSLRHKTNDDFWFTFFHEAGHVLLHGRKARHVDLAEPTALDDASEREADRFAADHLVPPSDAATLSSLRFDERTVRAFAARVGIAPGIVVGRLQKEKLLPLNRLNKLKVSYF